MVQAYGGGDLFSWDTTTSNGRYQIGVWTRVLGSPASRDTYAIITFYIY